MNRNRLPLFAALAAGILIGTLVAVMPAAQALSCTACVDSGDLVNNAVTTPKIANSAVNTSKIADSSIYSADIHDGAIGTQDLHPNARTAVGSVQLVGTPVSSGSTIAMDSFSVTVPATGQLLVRIDGSAFVDINAGGASSDAASGVIALCTASGSMTIGNCGSAFYTIWTQDADNADSINEVYGFSLVRQFSVSPGTWTFFVNGQANGATLSLFSSSAFNGATAVAEFFPTALTVTS